MAQTITMKLDRKTLVSKDHRNGVTLTRKKNNGDDSSLFMENEGCKKLTDNLLNIAETIDKMWLKQEGEAMFIPLTNSWVVEVNKFQGQVYSGVFDGRIMRSCGTNFKIWWSGENWLATCQKCITALINNHH